MRIALNEFRALLSEGPRRVITRPGPRSRVCLRAVLGSTRHRQKEGYKTVERGVNRNLLTQTALETPGVDGPAPHGGHNRSRRARTRYLVVRMEHRAAADRYCKGIPIPKCARRV